MTVEAALAACRFAGDAAAMLLWGAFAYLAVLVPPALRDRLAARLRSFRTAAILTAAAASVALLPIEAAAIGEGWPDALDPGTLGAVLGGTSVGWAWLARVATALPLVATLGQSLGAVGTAVLSAPLLASLALTGHAVMHEGALGVLHQLNDAVHVLAAGAWVGALVVVLPVLRALDDPDHRADAATALRRFSSAGHAAVALVVATGAANTALVLGRRPTDWSPYRALLAAKLALIAAMVALALANRYRFVPRMARRGNGARTAIRRATAVEIGLGLAAIACVGVFGLLDPS